MRLVVSPEARLDLREIGSFLAKHNPRHAIALIDQLESRFRRIALMPRACPLVPRHEDTGIRRAVHRSYSIFFTVEDDQVSVLRVLHGARDYERLLFPDDL